MSDNLRIVIIGDCDLDSKQRERLLKHTKAPVLTAKEAKEEAKNNVSPEVEVDQRSASGFMEP